MIGPSYNFCFPIDTIASTLLEILLDFDPEKERHYIIHLPIIALFFFL